MTTGPRPTPYPIVLQIDASGTPVGIGEASSLYVSSVSAVTITATNYIGLGSLSGYPGGSVGDIQVKSGNTTFSGYSNLRYDPTISTLFSNLLSSTSISAITLRAATVSATNYLNLPSTNLSSLLDVQYTSVSGGQALVYSSSINKWEPGYTIYKSSTIPTTGIGRNGDIYFRYIEDSTNAAYLSSLLDTNINAVSNGQSLIWSSGYWIPSAIPISQGAVTSIPSASPIWNAASAEGYDIQFGVYGNAPAAFDIIGFSLTPPYKITNFPLNQAGSVLVQQGILNNLIDLDVGDSQTDNILTKRNDGNWYGASTINVASISSTNWYGLPSATPIWNANKFGNYPITFPTTPGSLDLISFNFLGNGVQNVPASIAGPYLVAQANLSALADVDDDIPAVNNNILVYINGAWTPSALSGVSQQIANSINLSSLKDVDNTSATIGDLLAYNGNSWGPTLPSTLGAFALWNANKLQTVNISTNTPSTNNLLSYDGSQWMPASSIAVSSIVAVSADLSSVKLSKYVEPKSTVNISSSAITLNLNNSQVFEISATSNISSITIQNADSRSNIVQGFTIIFSADGTQRTVTNWGSIKWPGGAGPTLTSTNNKKDILSFMSPDNGTNWYGFIGGQNF